MVGSQRQNANPCLLASCLEYENDLSLVMNFPIVRPSISNFLKRLSSPRLMYINSFSNWETIIIYLYLYFYFYM